MTVIAFVGSFEFAGYVNRRSQQQQPPVAGGFAARASTASNDAGVASTLLRFSHGRRQARLVPIQ